MICGRLVTAYALAYARHAGLPEGGIAEAVEGRLALMPAWARAYAAASSAAALWLAPAVLLLRFRSFSALSEEEREAVLARALRCRPWTRAAFLGARALALAACYGRREARE